MPVVYWPLLTIVSGRRSVPDIKVFKMELSVQIMHAEDFLGRHLMQHVHMRR